MTSARIPGRATPEATLRHLSRFPDHEPHGHALLGSTGLRTGRLGFGCYRVDDETSEHREALRLALDSGCNLIDTSTNYTDGGSERLVGELLEDARRSGRTPREAVVVVTKIGYVQGQNLRLAMDREKAGFPFPGMVKVSDECWHCIHPEFLRDQLRRSRDRLRLETPDVCLLHNPEYFLADAKRRGRADDLDVLRAEFYGRVREAFVFFEESVAAGEIACYGVSSNTLVAAADDPEATSVTFLLRAAEEAGGKDHHFRVLQFPMNLFESGGALLLNTGLERRQTPLEAAARAGLAVLVNRPLNAIVGNRLIRLADPPVFAGPGIAACSARLKELEKEYRSRIAPLAGTPAEAIDPFFSLLDEISGLPDQVQDRDYWKQIEQQYVIPRLNHTARVMARDVDPGVRPQWEDWWRRCLPAIEELLEAIAHEASHRSLSKGSLVSEAIDPLLPAERRSETLSRKALWVLASTPGVGVVLAGMRTPRYVEDALGVLAWPPLPDPLAVYLKVKKARAIAATRSTRNGA